MKLILILALCLVPLGAQDKGRVFLISLDGMGFKAFTEDPAATDMKTMRRLAAEGISAPMQAAFPSLTAPGHASIFTGVYGNVNGVTSNNVPVTFETRANGFRAEQLKTEFFWLKPGRSGMKTVAHNPTQGFPCTQFNSGPNVTLMNGYQTPEVSPEKLVKAKDVTWLDKAPDGFATPLKSQLPIRYFRYDSGRIQFVGAVFAKGFHYDTIRMTAYSGKRYVDVERKESETEPVRTGNKTRPLARYFSEGLPIADITAVHFRLFELNAEGTDFLLYQTQAKEISICEDGDTQATKFKQKLLTTTGAFIGNGAGGLYTKGELGVPYTDGLAERRFLETLELHARQTMRHTRALLAEYDPRLLVDYISTPDDMLHNWWGNNDKMIEPYRRWGYQIIDERLTQLSQLLKEEDHIVVVSDHGMTAMHTELRINKLLEELGYKGRIAAQDHFLIAKDKDPALLEEVKQKLDNFRDGETKVFTEWFWPKEAATKFGIGGPFGGDLYFDLAPGYKSASGTNKPTIQKLERVKGEHGPLPTRPDLQALFIAYGPNLHSRAASMKTTNIAPLVLTLLGF
ncbi:MAG: alkaline phosphatase family protein [Acidobacteria bacterium]|nr:alkaline phosphatase family protein [Acidobacteriota bacterium]